MRQLKKYYGEVPTWVSPFLYHDRPFDGTERDAVKLDLFFYLPETEIIVEGTDVLLVREGDGTLGFVDIEKEHIFKLRSPTYATALKLLGKPMETIGVYRDYVGEAIGFWINPGAPLVVMFDEDTLTVNELLTTTKLLATPTSLQQRKHKAQGWDTLITCIPGRPPNHSCPSQLH